MSLGDIERLMTSAIRDNFYIDPNQKLFHFETVVCGHNWGRYTLSRAILMLRERCEQGFGGCAAFNLEILEQAHLRLHNL